MGDSTVPDNAMAVARTSKEYVSFGAFEVDLASSTTCPRLLRPNAKLSYQLCAQLVGLGQAGRYTATGEARWSD
jgi:hypothetical protein